MLRQLIILALFAATCASSPLSDVRHKVKCSATAMTVEMMLNDNVTDVYLEGMKRIGKDIGCQATTEGNAAVFRLSIVDFDSCGLTKVVDRSTGHRVYYHRIVVESDGGEKQVRLVKCGFHPAEAGGKSKRDILASDFVEDEEYDITIVEGRAVEPVLGIAVKQNGRLIDDNLNVQPGTALQMDIFLDDNSTSTYGLRVSYMDVTDRRTKEETIILNGCSVDPYLFENFNTLDGDRLTAKFKAFKFPETNFVLFRGTIDVCLDTCLGVECSNGQLGFGRKRRDVTPETDSNWRKDRVFEVSMTTVVKLDEQTNIKKDLLASSASSDMDTQPLLANQQQSTIDQSEPKPEPEPEPEPEPHHNSATSVHSCMFLVAALVSIRV